MSNEEALIQCEQDRENEKTNIEECGNCHGTREQHICECTELISEEQCIDGGLCEQCGYLLNK